MFAFLAWLSVAAPGVAEGSESVPTVEGAQVEAPVEPEWVVHLETTVGLAMLPDTRFGEYNHFGGSGLLGGLAVGVERWSQNTGRGLRIQADSASQLFCARTRSLQVGTQYMRKGGNDWAHGVVQVGLLGGAQRLRTETSCANLFRTGSGTWTVRWSPLLTARAQAMVELGGGAVRMRNGLTVEASTAGHFVLGPSVGVVGRVGRGRRR